MTRNSKLLQEFSEYCNSNTDQRFWQALRNWSGADYIMCCNGDEFDVRTADDMGMKDTYYWENKNN